MEFCYPPGFFIPADYPTGFRSQCSNGLFDSVQDIGSKLVARNVYKIVHFLKSDSIVDVAFSGFSPLTMNLDYF